MYTCTYSAKYVRSMTCFMGKMGHLGDTHKYTCMEVVHSRQHAPASTAVGGAVDLQDMPVADRDQEQQTWKRA